ncbi:putative RNA ligase I and tail attachment protein [Acinetobacter phage TAC1]|nr:putative RNA ligase I and tail attachment protein [Acinetobacter phage TAC1]
MSEVIRNKVVEQRTWAGQKVELTIKKYKPIVFHKNLWDQYPSTIKARGAVYHGNEQVVYPMDKCFNYLENGCGKDIEGDHYVMWYRKVNGFMMNLTYHEALGWIISTTGDAIIFGNVTENKYINMALQYIEKYDGFGLYEQLKGDYCYFDDDQFTVTFEVVHEDDPHIVAEVAGLYALCVQKNGVTMPLDVSLQEDGSGEFDDLKEALKTCNHEGFMVYNGAGELLFKMKSPYYLAKKWVQRGGAKRVWSNDYKERLDEEYYPIIDYLRSHHDKEEWDKMSEDAKSIAFLDAYYFVNNFSREG